MSGIRHMANTPRGITPGLHASTGGRVLAGSRAPPERAFLAPTAHPAQTPCPTAVPHTRGIRPGAMTEVAVVVTPKRRRRR